MRRSRGVTLLELMITIAVASTAVAAGLGLLAAARMDGRTAAVMSMVGRLADAGREHFGGRSNGYADITLEATVAALAAPGVAVNSPGVAPHLRVDGVKIELAAGAEKRDAAGTPIAAAPGTTMKFVLTDIPPSVCVDVANQYRIDAQVVRATGSNGQRVIRTGGVPGALILNAVKNGCSGSPITLEIQLL